MHLEQFPKSWEKTGGTKNREKLPIIMSVDRFIMIINVHLEGKNVLIMAEMVTSIRIAESPQK